MFKSAPFFFSFFFFLKEKTKKKQNTVQVLVTYPFVWSLRAEFGAISNSSAFTSGLSMCSLS